MTTESVRRLLDSGLDFALYRFPGEREPHLVLQTNGEALALETLHGGPTTNAGIVGLLPGNEPSGFIFAPFTETAKTPTLLIRPDVAVSGWELIDLETRTLGKQRRISLSSIDILPLRQVFTMMKFLPLRGTMRIVFPVVLTPCSFVILPLMLIRSVPDTGGPAGFWLELMSLLKNRWISFQCSSM